MAITANMVENESAVERETASRAVKARTVKVVELGTGYEHELPGDTPTRDARTLAYFSYPSGAVLPLVIRPIEAVFYVCSEELPELFGKLLRRV